MKKYIEVIIIIAITISIVNCKKDKKEIPKPNEVRYSWLKATILNQLEYDADTNKIKVDTFIFNNRKLTQIDCYDKNNHRILISFEGRDTGMYIMGEPNKFNYIRYADQNEVLWSSFNNNGLLHITIFDTVNKKISGTFYGGLKKASFPYDTIYVNNGFIEKIKFTAFK